MAEELLKKSKKQNVDVLIVGQGIAGSVLALTLIKQGKKVAIVSNANLSSSSNIAAGIWNPIVFKRLTHSWKATELLPALVDFYKWAEIILGSEFLQQRYIIKDLSNPQEEQFWKSKVAENVDYLDATVYDSFELDEASLLNRYSKVLKAGNINLPIFLNATRQYFEQQALFLNESFDYELLVNQQETISYKNITATQIVFCEGHLVKHNPFFNYIPLKPAKGEILTIQAPHFKWQHDIINKGIFILPIGDNRYKVGATYEWDDLTDIPSDNRKKELCAKLEKIISSKYTIIQHDAGVRPSSVDRRPIMGAHPHITNYFVFNGLGTKGVMLAPYFAVKLSHALFNNEILDDEINVKRFNHYAI